MFPQSVSACNGVRRSRDPGGYAAADNSTRTSAPLTHSPGSPSASRPRRSQSSQMTATSGSPSRWTGSPQSASHKERAGREMNDAGSLGVSGVELHGRSIPYEADDREGPGGGVPSPPKAGHRHSRASTWNEARSPRNLRDRPKFPRAGDTLLVGRRRARTAAGASRSSAADEPTTSHVSEVEVACPAGAEPLAWPGGTPSPSVVPGGVVGRQRRLLTHRRHPPTQHPANGRRSARP